MAGWTKKRDKDIEAERLERWKRTECNCNIVDLICMLSVNRCPVTHDREAQDAGDEHPSRLPQIAYFTLTPCAGVSLLTFWPQYIHDGLCVAQQ